ncbi:MAG: sugar transferase [Rhodobacterales bacterium]|nr:MAG: sugar transferase [Rhodobacterales bacterium]
MTPAKRMMDILLAVLLGVLLLPVLVGLSLAVLITSGRPIFYVSERMKTVDEPFDLIKLRTMTVAREDSGVSGADKAARITPIGRLLRKTRGDEIPQLWNILRGDMSFVGPRPPLRQYVERFPALYAQVLQSRPGVTGLASLIYHRHESLLLEQCHSAEETDAVYTRACVPRKATLDLIYQRHRSVCFDLAIMWRTAAGVFRR